MTAARLEHVNVTVSDPEATARMLWQLFGWRERWRGKAASGGDTIHVGTGTDYIAVYGAPDRTGDVLGHGKGRPLNHIGVVVADLDAVERAVMALGFAPFAHGDYEPGRRFYFFDRDGIEYEVVSYA